MRILLVSQMYPGPSAPDLGVFVQQIADELEGEGNELERVVIDHRGGSPAKYGSLAARAAVAARRASSARGSSSPPTGAMCATSGRSRGLRPRPAWS
jgi:hypothetical protein